MNPVRLTAVLLGIAALALNLGPIAFGEPSLGLRVTMLVVGAVMGWTVGCLWVCANMWDRECRG
jgi:hypothetical protein